MTLEEVAIHHRVNPNSLNTKDDALKIGIKSIKELVLIMEKRGVDKAWYIVLVIIIYIIAKIFS